MEKFLRKFCTIQYLYIYKKITCFVKISLVFDHTIHVNQLLSIAQKIYASFDCNPTLDVRAVFLDISKAFDRVWHEGLIYKIKCMGTAGLTLKQTQSCLSNRL